MINYPQKCWYVAATCDEIDKSPLGRRLLGEDVVLWRGASGRVVAFENRCAHRAFPLSHSTIDEDRLVCGYHGCTYDADGKCVLTPVQPQVPTGMSVPVFPVLERPPFVWIWLGPPAGSASIQPPRLPWINDPAWATFADAWQVRANYMMVHEHYLDFSYAPVLHASKTPPGLRSMPAFNDIEVTETTVSYSRVIQDAPLAEWEAEATGLDSALGYRRRELGTFASPALHFQSWNIETSAGALYTTGRIHAITPETDDATHVFMMGAHNYSADRTMVTTYVRSLINDIAQRDISILEMVSNHSGYDAWRSGVEFQSSAAILRARRIVGVMLANEAGRSAVRPGLARTRKADLPTVINPPQRAVSPSSKAP